MWFLLVLPELHTINCMFKPGSALHPSPFVPRPLWELWPRVPSEEAVSSVAVPPVTFPDPKFASAFLP